MNNSMEALYRMRGLIVKETFQIIRDPSSILVAFFLPLLLLFLTGYAISLDANTIKAGIVVEDPNVSSDQITQSFEHSTYFDVHASDHREGVEDELIASKLRGIVVIPSYFDKRNKDQRIFSPMQVITDGSEPNTAAIFQNYSRGTWQNWLILQGKLKGKDVHIPIGVEHRVWYNAEIRSQNSIIPGSLALILTMVGSLLTALVVSREWERGTMEALMTTPISILELIVGKLIPYFILGFGTLLLCYFFSVYVYDVPYRGSFWLMLAVGSLYLFTALNFGLLISTLARSQFIAAQISIFTAFMPAFLLSGFIFELSSLPLPLQIISYIFTARYLVSAMQTLYLSGDIYPVIAGDCFGIALICSILIFIIARKTRKKLD